MKLKGDRDKSKQAFPSLVTTVTVSPVKHTIGCREEKGKNNTVTAVPVLSLSHLLPTTLVGSAVQSQKIGRQQRRTAPLNSLGGCKCGTVVSTLSQIDTRHL